MRLRILEGEKFWLNDIPFWLSVEVKWRQFSIKIVCIIN